MSSSPALSKSLIAVIGSGPAGLAAAEKLAQAGYAVSVFERMPSPARKFLLAGRGGLNLTHSEELGKFLTRYEPCPAALLQAVGDFPPELLRQWADGLGQETFTGSSGRVFPKDFKATPLLRAWLVRLDKLGVRFHYRHLWTGWNADGALTFQTPNGPESVTPAATLLALGGASWPRLGSDGSWVDLLSGKAVEITPLKPANMGFLFPWSEHFLSRFEGAPLKGAAFSFKGKGARGEAIISKNGIEGGAIYAIGRAVRDAILSEGSAIVSIDLKPDMSEATLTERFSRDRKGQSLSNFLRKAAGLPPLSIALLREGTAGDIPAEPQKLAALIKHLPLVFTGCAPITRAISTGGGIAFSELEPGFMLSKLPGIFVAGEMLDWEAPTGGYLLQGCFATGIAAANGIMNWHEERR